MRDEELWQRVHYWRDRLKDCDDYPTLISLEHSWLFGHNQDVEDGYYTRDEKPSDNPISAIVFFVEMGFYPPPEYMLTLLDCFEAYKAGDDDLEKIFFGRSRQRAGTYAARKRKGLRDLQIKMEFSSLLREGMSRTDAAEKIVYDLSLDIDADSVLRMLRGFKGLSKKPEK